jgi:hypothetical protein
MFMLMFSRHWHQTQGISVPECCTPIGSELESGRLGLIGFGASKG